MLIFKMFVCLCLSALTLLGGYSLNVSAEESTEDYGIMPLAYPSADNLGYASFVNTGNDEWGTVLSYMGQFIDSDSSTYIMMMADYQQIQLYWNFDYSSGDGLHFTKVAFCSAYNDTSYSCVNVDNDSSMVRPWLNRTILAMYNVPQPSYYSNIENWNALSFNQAVALYENSNSGDSSQAIIDAINNQWAIDDGEDFGTDSLVTELEGKLGVLGFASDTLIQFVDLFDSSNAGSTTLTFPAFSLNVQGHYYTIWDDVSFDMNSIYNDFSFLIDTVRTILTLFVWLAVFNYCVKSYERVVNR